MAEQCAAHNRQGGRCGQRAMLGQSVCFMHGGKSPQALAKAEERMRALIHPSLSRLAGLIEKADSDSVSLNATRYVLDWAGFKATVQVQSDHEVTIRVIDESQPIVLEHTLEQLSNGNGRTHS